MATSTHLCDVRAESIDRDVFISDAAKGSVDALAINYQTAMGGRFIEKERSRSSRPAFPSLTELLEIYLNVPVWGWSLPDHSPEYYAPELACKFLKRLARPTGFEPATCSFGGCHSIQLSYGRVRESLTDRSRDGRTRAPFPGVPCKPL